MFADVVSPSITVGSRTWYWLPLSIAAHAVIVAVVLIVPMMTADVVRLPPSVITFLASAAAPLPPPPPPLDPEDRPIEWRDPRAADLAPVKAPSGVTAEREAERRRVRATAVPDTPSGAISGFEERLEPELPPPPPAPSVIVVRVGGNIRPPSKLKDVKPIYPSIAQAARVEGVVIIEATIGPDGKIEGTRVLRSIPFLDAAAVEAVRQWEYTPTLLNGSPVSLLMTVIVTFTLSP